MTVMFEGLFFVSGFWMVRKILASIFLGSLIQAGIFLDIQYAFWKFLCLGNLIRHGIFGGFVGSPRDFLGC